VLTEGGPGLRVSTPESDPEFLRSRRRFSLGCAVGIVLAMALFVWMISLGTWDLVQSGFFTNFYDAQARALFHGHWNVPPSVVQIEGFVVKGRTYMYLGPFPALIRMPILLVTSSLDGRLTQLSILLAMLVALVCTGRLAWKIRNLVSSAPVSVKESVLVAFAVAATGTGSVFLFLTTVAVVYHEAEAWGAALAIAAFDALVGFLIRPSTRGVVITAVLATLDLITRGSVGLGPVAALGLLALLHGALSLRRRGSLPRLPFQRSRPTGLEDVEDAQRFAWIGVPDAATAPTRTIALSCATVVAVVAYAWVNYSKFGSLFHIPWTSQVARKSYEPVRAVLAANGGSLLGLKFVPTALVQYLRPDALRTTRLFPFVGFPPPATVIGHVVYEYRDPASSITSTMPAFLILGAIGVWSVFRPSRRPRHGTGSSTAALAVLRAPLLGAAVGTLGSLEIAYIAERYLADWMPLLVVAGLAGLVVVVQRTGSMRRWARRTVTIALCVLAVFGVLANLSLSLVYQRELNPFYPPAPARAQFISLQERVDQALFGKPRGVSIVAQLPPVEPAGSVVILGNCAAMYQSDGQNWDPVEQSAAGGHYRLRVTFASVPGPSDVYWPLVVTGGSGAGDYVAVRSVGTNRVRFAYLYQRPFKHGTFRAWSEGSPIQLEPGRTYVVDVVLDANTRNEEVRVNGMLAATGVYVRTPTDVTFGTDTIAGPTAATFPGKVERLATPTPTCDALRRRVMASGG
jgi:hypothetical protein